jgi:hypothetical protein
LNVKSGPGAGGRTLTSPAGIVRASLIVVSGSLSDISLAQASCALAGAAHTAAARPITAAAKPVTLAATRIVASRDRFLALRGNWTRSPNKMAEPWIRVGHERLRQQMIDRNQRCRLRIAGYRGRRLQVRLQRDSGIHSASSLPVFPDCCWGDSMVIGKSIRFRLSRTRSPG